MRTGRRARGLLRALVISALLASGGSACGPGAAEDPGGAGGAGGSGGAGGDGDRGGAGGAQPGGGAPCGEAGDLLSADCVPVGVPPEGCAEGFEPDGDGGCAPRLPAEACPAGAMAIPGEASCRPVSPCAEGRFGDAPIDASTELVDPASGHKGPSDGSAERPWTTLQQAIDAATPGGLVALAAGTYVGEATVSGKGIRLWGRCPELVSIEGAPGDEAALSIFAGADGTEVHGVALTGAGRGARIRDAKGVRLERVWVHDTKKTGLSIIQAEGAEPASAEIVDSLFERTTFLGVGAVAAALSIDRTVIRDTLRDPTEAFSGYGVYGQDNPSTKARSAISLRRSVVERSRGMAVFVGGSDVTVEGSLVRDTSPEVKADGLGRGVCCQQNPATGNRCSLSVRGSVLERNGYSGILAMGGDAEVLDTVVRDTGPSVYSGKFGVGLNVQAYGAGRPKVVARRSLFERNMSAGILLLGADAELERVLVRDTRPREADARFGRGINVQLHPETGEPSSATILSSAILRSRDFGIVVLASDAVIDGTLVREVGPQASDGKFGDGIAIWSDSEAFSTSIAGGRVSDSARAGISSFGARVTLGSTRLACNAIDLNGEPLGDLAYSFEDQGENACGCGEVAGPCRISTSSLEPPAPYDP